MDNVNYMVYTNGSISKMLYIILLSLNIVYGGLPVSYPDTLNKQMGGKNVPYNVIDVYPSCWERGYCPMFRPGSELAAFPNSEEKTQMIFKNMFRMFANCTLTTKWGKWRFGANTNGGETYFCPTCRYCGDGKPDKGPLYWYSDANQAARFKQYDERSCDQNWYKEAGITAHHTCNWVKDEWGGGSNCDLFGGCEFGHRSSKFCVEDRCWFETEGICGANSCYFDPHCEPIFAAKYDYQGAGFVEGTNGVDTVYSRFTKEIFYVLPMGAHFDERIKVIEEDYNVDGKYFTLMLQYFDHNYTQKPYKCWSLYDGNAHEMEVAISWNSLNGSQCGYGYSNDCFSVLFTTNHFPPIMTCEPYAFICKTTLGNYFRLPEEGNYYFGTEWLDWKWSDYEGDYNLKCRENHYYFDGYQWLVNGGPELKKCDIWYYNNVDYSECIGCSKIAKLDCIANCIYSDSLNNCNCNNEIGQNIGYEWCTPSPTRNPLSGGVTYSPTPSPTPSPTDPTTARPSRSPIPKPTRSPLPYGQTYPPTLRPSKHPLPPGYTHNPTYEPSMLTTDLGYNNNNNNTGNNAGVIAAGIIGVLIFIICILSWIYFRIHTGKPLYPTKSDLVLPGYGINNNTNNTSTNNVSQMSTQLSNHDKIRKQQSIQAGDESDDDMDEGDGYYKTAKGIKNSGDGKGKRIKPQLPVMKPPPIPNTNNNNAPVTGLHLDTNDAYDIDGGVNEATPLANDNDDDINMEYPTDNQYLSIDEAKKQIGNDKEKYLNDDDFKSVFGMNKDEFKGLSKWKQKSIKKQKGFF